MYTLKSAIGKPLNNRRWEAVEIGDIPLPQLYTTYSSVKATLSNNFLDHDVALDLEDIREQYGAQWVTFNEMLAGLGNKSLPTTNTLPVIDTKYAVYNDMWKAGYKINVRHPTAALDADVADEDKTWLFLTRDKTNYDDFGKYVLVNVNGYFHKSETDTTGVYVVDGRKTQLVCNQNMIGGLSFQNIGAITQVPITADMIYKQNQDVPLKSGCYLNVSEDLEGKTVLLVLGGYIHVLDNRTFRRVGDTNFRVDWQYIPLLDRYFESKRFLDLSSLGLYHPVDNSDAIETAELFSDSVLTKYLTLSQSFLVVVDTSEMFVKYSTLRNGKTPNAWLSWEKPNHLLMAGCGRAINYRTELEKGIWAVTSVNAFYENRIYAKTRLQDRTVLDNSRQPQDPVQNSAATFMMIGKDI